MSQTASARTPPDVAFPTGILPAQELERLIAAGAICAEAPIVESQVQPASLDLRLGARAYRVRASFLPGGAATVGERLRHYVMHEMDLTAGAVLERGGVYIVPLLEGLRLPAGLAALGNPKSSTGRIDVFTRLITDYGMEFDRVRDGYQGPLYAEISPRTFSVLVRTGSRLSQLRVRRGATTASDEHHKQLQEKFRLVDRELPDEQIRNGVPITVDVRGDGRVIGYRAKAHAGLVDVDQVGRYDFRDYWDPVHAPGKQGLILDPDEFYILASREAVKVPAGYAAEMIAYDTLVGEFRVHYAGFFDPGFGDAAAGGEGARAVLEVRSYEVPFVLEDAQIVGRLVYERLTSPPARLYGQDLRSNYQRQGLRLSKHFRMDDAP